MRLSCDHARNHTFPSIALKTLRTLLQESLTRLDHIKDGYHAFQQKMLSELAKYPVAVAATVSNYDMKLCKYLQVERKPAKVKACLLAKRRCFSVEGSLPASTYFLMHNIYPWPVCQHFRVSSVVLWLCLYTFCTLCVCVCVCGCVGVGVGVCVGVVWCCAVHCV